MLGRGARDFLKFAEIPSPPAVAGFFQGNWTNLDNTTASARGSIGNFSYRAEAFTAGSAAIVVTNHTLHLVSIARAAGLTLTWDDFADLSEVVPLLCRIYPNGTADVNHFHAAGGMGFLIRELLEAGYLHEDVRTVWGDGLSLDSYGRYWAAQTRTPWGQQHLDRVALVEVVIFGSARRRRRAAPARGSAPGRR